MNYSSLQLKPHLEARAACHACGQAVEASALVWQGIHVCAEYRCGGCGAQFIEDLPIGHAISSQFRVDAERGLLNGNEGGRKWFGEPLLQSIRNPNPSPVPLEVEKRRETRSVVVLNCIDFLYGHCLLKLLNAASHLREDAQGLVVIVPKFLAWMVPEGVAEVWKVDLPLQRAQEYYPDLHRRISKELERFGEARLSRAFSHPTRFRIEDFTGVQAHQFTQEHFRITFIWRADRLWFGESLWMAFLTRLGFGWLLRILQRRKIAQLLGMLRATVPQATMTVAGIGREGTFPAWIDDQRVQRVDTADSERQLCRIYAQSRVVIGVHGSSMLLPSGHAGMTVDLMPGSRWDNIGQDILFRQGEFDDDLRLSAYRFRFLPVESGLHTLATVIAGMIGSFDAVHRRFVSEIAGYG